MKCSATDMSEHGSKHRTWLREITTTTRRMSQTEDFGGSGVGYVVVKREREGDDDPVLGAHVHADRIAPEHRHRHRVVDALCCPNDRIMMTMGGCEQGQGAGAGSRAGSRAGSTDGRQADPTRHLAASGRQRQAEGGGEGIHPYTSRCRWAPARARHPHRRCRCYLLRPMQRRPSHRQSPPSAQRRSTVPYTR